MSKHPKRLGLTTGIVVFMWYLTPFYRAGYHKPVAHFHLLSCEVAIYKWCLLFKTNHSFIEGEHMKEKSSAIYGVGFAYSPYIELIITNLPHTHMILFQVRFDEVNMWFSLFLSNLQTWFFNDFRSVRVSCGGGLAVGQSLFVCDWQIGGGYENFYSEHAKFVLHVVSCMINRMITGNFIIT